MVDTQWIFDEGGLKKLGDQQKNKYAFFMQLYETISENQKSAVWHSLAFNEKQKISVGCV